MASWSISAASCTMYIHDAIKQNKSCAQSIFCFLHNCIREKPHENWLISSRDTSSWRFCTTKHGKCFPFACLYLLINICELQLILLDRISYTWFICLMRRKWFYNFRIFHVFYSNSNRQLKQSTKSLWQPIRM